MLNSKSLNMGPGREKIQNVWQWTDTPALSFRNGAIHPEWPSPPQPPLQSYTLNSKILNVESGREGHCSMATISTGEVCLREAHCQTCSDLTFPGPRLEYQNQHHVGLGKGFGLVGGPRWPDGDISKSEEGLKGVHCQKKTRKKHIALPWELAEKYPECLAMGPFETPDPFKITLKLKCPATSTITCVEFWDLKHET